MPGHELLTKEEVAALLRVHPRTVTRWYREGRLPGTKINGHLIRFRAEDLNAIGATPPEKP